MNTTQNQYESIVVGRHSTAEIKNDACCIQKSHTLSLLPTHYKESRVELTT